MASVKNTGTGQTTRIGRLLVRGTAGIAGAAEGPVSPKDLAAERLADYYRSLGLRDERFLEETVTRVMESAERNLPGEDAEAYLEEAMERAVRDFQQWLDDLVAWARSQGADRVARGCMAWRLRRLLGDYPDMFLKTEGLPDGFREGLLEAAAPVLPEPNPFPMAPQKIRRARFFGSLSLRGRLLRHGGSTSGARDQGRPGEGS